MPVAGRMLDRAVADRKPGADCKTVVDRKTVAGLAVAGCTLEADRRPGRVAGCKPGAGLAQDGFAFAAPGVHFPVGLRRLRTSAPLRLEVVVVKTLRGIE